MPAPYFDQFCAAHVRQVVINFNGTGDNIVVSAGGGRRRVQLYQVFFVVDAATTIKWRSGSTDITGPVPLVQYGSFVLDNNREPWLITNEGEDLVINQTGTAGVGGALGYWILDNGGPGSP